MLLAETISAPRLVWHMMVWFNRTANRCRKSSASESGCSGSGNQNMLDASARRVSTIPLMLLLYAK